MKELNRFRQFLTEGKINENLSQNLIKVYEDEIESMMASEEDEAVEVLRMGISLLQRGEDPNKVNRAIAKKVAQIQGEFDWDEFARIYMDNAQGQINENFLAKALANLGMSPEKLHELLDNVVDQLESTIPADKKEKFDQAVEITRDKIDRGAIQKPNQVIAVFKEIFV